MICDVIYLNILMWKYNLITNNNNQRSRNTKIVDDVVHIVVLLVSTFQRDDITHINFINFLLEIGQCLSYINISRLFPFCFFLSALSFISALYFFLSALSNHINPPPPNFPQTSIYCVLFLNSLKKPPLPSQLISTSDYLKHERNVDP